MKIIQHVGRFIYKVWETKMSIWLINKQVSVGELVLQSILVFLVEAHLKPILGYSSEIDHCEVDFCNVHVELH